MYHYTDSGLDYVYLQNGYEIHSTPYGEGIAIEDVEGLHEAITRWVIDNPHKLRGAELRFLRKELDLTQALLSGILGESRQKILRWERDRDKDIPGSADRFLRAFVKECLDGNSSIADQVRRIAELDEKMMAERVNFCETDTGWTTDDCVAA